MLEFCCYIAVVVEYFMASASSYIQFIGFVLVSIQCVSYVVFPFYPFCVRSVQILSSQWKFVVVVDSVVKFHYALSVQQRQICIKQYMNFVRSLCIVYIIAGIYMLKMLQCAFQLMKLYS